MFLQLYLRPLILAFSWSPLQGGDELLDAMGALTIAPSPEVALLGPYELRGMPRPQGQHVRQALGATQSCF